MAPNLEERSRIFAEEVGTLLEATVGCPHSIVSVRVHGSDKFVVRPEETNGRRSRIPLLVGGEHLADLEITLFQVLDRSGDHLKTSKTDFRVFSTIDRTPLLRLEYDSSASVVPSAHWQFHAERGAFVHLLTIASRTREVRGPGDLSKLHLPVGGERFRPGLEDLLELLIRDCGIDAEDGWEAAIKEGRKRWRVRQLRSAVRDQPEEAAEVLRNLGWQVSASHGSASTPHDDPFTHW